MQQYLVGGAVRDTLLGLDVKDRDWVVVGATPQELQTQGYQQVGKDFPVFLHPKTREEYALARAERKVGLGHKGFECVFDPSVKIDEDLMRRDLTINAMAMRSDKTIIDPYNGQKDLKDKVLRHVSPAFVEDPLRVYRVARFQAMLPEFTIDDETLGLMQTIVASGELKTLSKERVVAELRKALKCPAPWQFLKVLSDVGVKDIYIMAFDVDTAAKMLRLIQPEKEVQSLMILLWGQPAVVPEGLLDLGLPQELKRVCETHLVWSDFTMMRRHDTAAWRRLLSALDAWRRPQLLKMYLWYYDIVFGTDYGMRWQKMYADYKAVKWSYLLENVPQEEIVTRVSGLKTDLINKHLII